MQKNEPNLWRTDLIVFIENSFDLLNELTAKMDICIAINNVIILIDDLIN